MGTGALSPGMKWPEREADHSPPTSSVRGQEYVNLRVSHAPACLSA
jgi:hypothetical protein